MAKYMEVTLEISDRVSRKLKNISDSMHVSDREVIEYLLLKGIFMCKKNWIVFEEEIKKVKVRKNENENKEDEALKKRKVKISASICKEVDEIAKIYGNKISLRKKRSYMITKLLNLSINRMESICDVTKQNEKKEFLLEKRKIHTYVQNGLINY